MISVIFQDQQCAKAKLEIQLKLERFGNDYFYTLGLNRKFCAGIGDFFRLRVIFKITSSPNVLAQNLWVEIGLNNML